MIYKTKRRFFKSKNSFRHFQLPLSLTEKNIERKREGGGGRERERKQEYALMEASKNRESTMKKPMPQLFHGELQDSS